MANKADTLHHENERKRGTQDLKREDAFRALQRLRELGESLPKVDAAAIVRESRALGGQGSR